MNAILLISHIKSEEKIPMDPENFTAMVSRHISTIGLNSYVLVGPNMNITVIILLFGDILKLI